MNRKKLLVLNYDMPPSGGAGVKRCLKFMKYLPDNGWDISVLTVKNGNHSIIDQSLLEEIDPSIHVYRTATIENLFKNESHGNSTLNKTGPVREKPLSPLKVLYKRLGRYLKIPDSRILWIPTALPYGLYRILRDRYDVVFATGPSFTNLILATLLKKITGRPLVVDFRDAWTSDPMLHSQDIDYLRRVHRMLERMVIRSADLIMTTNPYVTADFIERNPDQNRTKFDTFFNGYDGDDFNFLDDLQPAPSTGKFRVVYTGRLYGERTPKHFLRAFRRALEISPEMEDKIELVLVGSVERFLDGCVVEDYVHELGLEKNVVLTGQVSRKESFRLQAEADLLLLLIGIVPVDKELTYGISGKVFDYILSRKPILTLADGGAMRNFIENNNIGHLFHHADTEETARFIVDAFLKWEKGEEPVIQDVGDFPQFEFRAITRELSTKMDALIHR